jgi:hypothetical protein
MCTVQLPPDGNPVAVNKYIISYHKIVKKDDMFRAYVAMGESGVAYGILERKPMGRGPLVRPRHR